MLFKKSKKNIAILLVIAMLLTIMPMTVFAEGEEGAVFGAALTYTANEEDTTLFNLRADVTSGSHLITTPSLLQVKWVVNGTDEGDFSREGIPDEAIYAQKDITVTEDTTVKAVFDYNGVQFESNEVKIEAEVKSVIVDNTMSQADIQAAINDNDEIVFKAGTYNNLRLTVSKDTTKIFKTDATVKFVGKDGSAITLQENANLNMQGGEFEFTGYAIGINISSAGEHHFTLQSGVLNCHDMVNWYGNGAFSIGGSNTVVYLNFNEGTSFISKNCYAGIELNNSGGSVYTTFDRCKLVDLSNNGFNVSGSGIQAANTGNIYQEIVISSCEEVHMDNNALDAICTQSSELGGSKIKIENCKNITMNNNGSWGTNGGYYTVIDSDLIISGNGISPWNKVAITGSNFYCFELVANNSTIVADNANANCGIWVAGPAIIENCDISAQKSAAVRNEKGGVLGYYNNNNPDANFYYRANYPYASGNGCFFGGETIISNTKINASNNAGAGIVFKNNMTSDSKSIFTASEIIADNNGYGQLASSVGNHDYIYKSGIAVIAGQVDVVDTYVSVVGNEKYGIGYYSDEAYKDVSSKVIFDGNSVAKSAMKSADGAEIYSDAENKDTYVLSGSFQGIHDNMTGTYDDTWNTVKGVEEVYAAPINNEGTKLTRFDLHNEVNKEVGLQSEQAKWTNKSFTYYDPNNKESKYDYQFRFNKDGEDLVEGESGNAYVWTPASVLHYDATEGTVDSLGTAGEITVGNSTANQTGDNTGLNTRYTQDVTIYGNSLNLAEKTMPTAARTGYVFLGWYVADDEEKAKEYASKGEFENLYNLLNTEFTASSKVATDLDDVSKGQADKTIYAKWASTLIQGTIFEDGTRNNVLDTNEYVFEKIPVRLMQDGKVVATTETNVDGKYRFDGVDLGKYTVEIDWPKKDNVAMKNICTVNNTEAGNKFNAGTDNAFATSIEIEISEEFREATLNAGFYNTSGGGGSTTDPEPVGPGTDEPTVDIPDPDVPLTEPDEPEDPTIDIEDPDVPLVDVPGETVEIEEPEVPLGDAPATGDRSAAIPFAVLMLIAAAGLAITRKRFN